MALLKKRITQKNALQALIAHTDKPAELYRNGFYFMSGLFGGILLNDAWQFFNLPGNDIPLGTPVAKKLGIDMDFVYQFLIGASFIGADILLGLSNGTSFGSGIILGAKYANTSEHGQYIGNVGLIT
jgi:hypothetical protein